ncbi:hypothetical protein SAMN05216367_4451 [Tardiphaga sp. OK245]|jgi:hypothetical protein|nr:hypothetical protein SAMN05216367_4451 [Tardiphaga sp. OK245]
MSVMPLITDEMVVQSRQTGKRRSSYRSNRRGRTERVGRVILQAGTPCFPERSLCFTRKGQPGKCMGGICVREVIFGSDID